MKVDQILSKNLESEHLGVKQSENRGSLYTQIGKVNILGSNKVEIGGPDTPPPNYTSSRAFVHNLHVHFCDRIPPA